MLFIWYFKRYKQKTNRIAFLMMLFQNPSYILVKLTKGSLWISVSNKIQNCPIIKEKTVDFAIKITINSIVTYRWRKSKI